MKVGFVGAGKMAEAIVEALIERGLVGPEDVAASDIDSERLRRVGRTHGIRTCTDNPSVADGAEVLFLAVKPQHLDGVLDELAPHVADEQIVVSIAAGRTLASLERRLPAGRLVRVMPNLATQVEAGMSVFCLGPRTRPEDAERISTLLGAFGLAAEMGEEKFDAVTALSGSGPAFLCYVLDAMAGAAVEQGLTPGEAALLARQTMLGTARVLLERDMPPGELIAAVASPGGTTEAGLRVLGDSRLAQILQDTIGAAAARSRELSG